MTTIEAMRHIATFFAAIYASEGWYLSYEYYQKSATRHGRKHATYARTRAIVLFDRILCNGIAV